ncbi:MAG: hypothetical protein COA52_09535 [Hyphomicrobiales bacterium]|nr:MAG: hypothetical protein COA52_09535 [Hyphomicrobiales bacterium]
MSGPERNGPDRDNDKASSWLSPAQGTIIREAHYPARAPIDAYGNGGFRFADMSHKGGILALPSGIYGWDGKTPEDVTLPMLSRAIDEGPDYELLFLGMGQSGAFPTKETMQGLREIGIRFEIMSTGAAIRTFNVLLAEGRAIAAALLPVDNAK